MFLSILLSVISYLFHDEFPHDIVLRAKRISNRRAAGGHSDHSQSIMPCPLKIIRMKADGGEAFVFSRVH